METRFPYVAVTIRFPGPKDLPDIKTELLVDTGFDGDVILPNSYIDQLGNAEGLIRWQLADGSTVSAPLYECSIQLSGLPSFFPATVSLLGAEGLVGRSITDRVRLILDHGERVLIEP